MYEVVVTVIAVLSAAVSALLFIKGNYHSKLLTKLGLKEPKEPINWTAFSWESCLSKLDCKADVVFFGDSIVRGGNFHQKFSHRKIVNLGCSGDTLAGMINRVSAVKMFSPEKIFFLGGINGLTDFNLPVCVKTYSRLMDELSSAAPCAQVYLHSLLPISAEKEKHICKNTTIEAFNREIEKIAQKRGFTFIDLHPHYTLKGKMDPQLTVDGLHLKPEAYDRWYGALEKHIPQKAPAESGK